MMPRAAKLLSLCAMWILLGTAAAMAHPLGNFTVNVASDIEVTASELLVHHVVDMAEIPTAQEMAGIDSDGDGAASASELQTWANAQAGMNASLLRVSVDGKPLELSLVGTTAAVLDGQAGLPTLRLDSTFAAPIAQERGELAFEDGTFEGKTGWREVTLRGSGVLLEGATVPTSSPTQMLRTYPADPGAATSAVTTAKASFEPNPAADGTSPGDVGQGAPESAAAGSAAPAARPSATDGFTNLLGGEGLSLLVIVVAAGFGAAHALAPGHGKTLMAAYMVGSGARVRQAAAAGVAVAMMHTASVLALGVLILALGSRFTPERIYPWMSLLSGSVILLIGGRLLYQRLQAFQRLGHAPAHDYPRADGHGHSDGHAIDHGHAHGHSDAHAHGAENHHAGALPASESLLSRRGLVALAASGGILPSPTALVVLLGAIAVDRLAFGLSLILAFSVGMAAALVVIALVAIRARDALASRVSVRLASSIPVAGAAVMLVAGFVLAVSGGVRI